MEGGCPRRQGAMHTGPHTREFTQERLIPLSLALQNRGAEFHEFLKREGVLGAWKVSWHSTRWAGRGDDTWVATFKETAAYMKRQHKNSRLHNARGKLETEIFILIVKHVEDFFENEGAGRRHFTPLPTSINMKWPAGGGTTQTLGQRMPCPQVLRTHPLQTC